MSTNRDVSGTLTVAPATVSAPVMPALAHVVQTRSRWRETQARGRASHKIKRVPIGTTFSFDLNEPARVSLTFTKQSQGTRVGKGCVSRKAHTTDRRRCIRSDSGRHADSVRTCGY